MKNLVMILAIALAAPAAHAGEICKYIDFEGNIRYSTMEPEPGWRKLACADQGEDEPISGTPQDPHKVLKDGRKQLDSLKCRLIEGTRELVCIDIAHIESNNDIRFGQIFRGRPDRVRGTATYLVIDCKAILVSIEDRNRKQLTGESPATGNALMALARYVCALIGQEPR